MHLLRRCLSILLIIICIGLPCIVPAETAWDASRTEHNIGTCRSLSQDAAIIILFAKDDLSSWDDDSISSVYRRVEEAAQFLRETAASYGCDLTLPVYCYTDNENREIRYSGVISSGGPQLDALSSISANWGYDSKQAMHEALQEYTGMEQLAYIVVHNKAGYSYAQGQSHISEWNEWSDPEYCVLAVRSEDGDTFPPATYLHELLHLFGAQDIYRKDFGDVVYNDKRAALCRKLCPNAVMLNNWNDLSQTSISGFTAYCIGLIDFLPANYDVSDWWIDSQWANWYLP